MSETNSNEVVVSIKNLQKAFGDNVVLRDIDLDVHKGEVVVVLGPSGSGKSTMLRCINRLEHPTSGSIVVEGVDVCAKGVDLNKVRTHLGMVFQQFNLFPHLSVKKNVMLAQQKVLKRSKEEAEKIAVEELTKVGLAERIDFMPSQLSGGQQQRVAIARALVTGPSIICMDEPLSNLDAKLRVQLRNELKKMQREFGITTIYVTHDQEEALTLSDRIAVFNKGYIEQIGTPNEIYNHSKTEFVCNFIGDINRVEAPIAAKMKLAAGQNHFIRLERLHVNKPKRDDEILIDGVVENIEYYGLYIKYYIDVGSQILKAIEKNDGINIYAPGEKVTVAMKPTDVMSYDAQ